MPTETARPTHIVVIHRPGSAVLPTMWQGAERAMREIAGILTRAEGRRPGAWHYTAVPLTLTAHLGV